MSLASYVYLFKDGTIYTHEGKISAELKECLIAQHGKLVHMERM